MPPTVTVFLEWKEHLKMTSFEVMSTIRHSLSTALRRADAGNCWKGRRGQNMLASHFFAVALA